jgi:hypothetical protein
MASKLVRDVVGWGFWLVLFPASLIFIYVKIFGVPSFSGAKVEDFDKWVARVDAALAAKQVAAMPDGVVCSMAPLALSVIHGGANATGCERLPDKPLAKPLAVIDVDDQRIDKVSGRLPESLIAPSLDAAGTLVFIHCSPERAGTYGSIFTHDAYRLQCAMLFVGQNGPAGMRILGVMQTMASPPQKIDTRFTFGDVVADRPVSSMQRTLQDQFDVAEKP